MITEEGAKRISDTHEAIRVAGFIKHPDGGYIKDNYRLWLNVMINPGDVEIFDMHGESERLLSNRVYRGPFEDWCMLMLFEDGR